MEQKKTLWIITASGLFLLGVLGAAMVFNSKPANTPTTAYITTIDKTPVAVQPVTPVTSNTDQALDSSSLVLQGVEEGENLASAENTITAENADITINANTTNIELKTVGSSSSNLTATSRAGEEALAGANGTKTYTEKVEAPKAVAAAPAKKSTSTKPAAKSTASAAPKVTTSAISTKYWVQAASFTNKKSADNARTALDDNKIPAEVFTYKDDGDTLFYRVRVGPYTTKSEAEYWKGRIASIDLFKDTQSYVTAVSM